jgi:glutamine synthetase
MVLEKLKRYSNDVMKIADSIVTVKETFHNLGMEWGYTISFMPKPDRADIGSGMHLHFSFAGSRGEGYKVSLNKCSNLF